MTIKEFIEKAIEGGWQIPMLLHFPENNDGQMNVLLNNASDILLDPLAWQAVGKVEMENGNGEWAGIGTGDLPQSHYSPGWRRNMHRLIDALADGKTIEQFLSTL